MNDGVNISFLRTALIQLPSPYKLHLPSLWRHVAVPIEHHSFTINQSINDEVQSKRKEKDENVRRTKMPEERARTFEISKCFGRAFRMIGFATTNTRPDYYSRSY